ncbi:MAG: YihY family inner membrane protein [Pseudomarimonas sp.]
MRNLHHLRRRIPAHIREPLGAFSRFVWHRYVEDRCFETAGVLAYASVFALVPLSVAIFGIFAAFPVFEAMSTRLTEFLFTNFLPTAARAVEAYLRQFADSAARLTSVGVIALLVSALLMMKSIEDTFNRIWRVSAPRPGLSRVLVYWTVLTLGPILAVSSLALSSYLLSLTIVGNDQELTWGPRLLSVVPLLVELAAFTLAYAIIPNRRVFFRHALAGGVLATILFEVAKRGFAYYLQQVPSYEQIYGTLAVLPIFLIWLYLSWVVILLGASIAASLSAFRYQRKDLLLPRGYEMVGLLRLVGRLHDAQARGAAVSVEALQASEPSLSDDLLMQLLGLLRAGYIVQRNEVGDWLLARDLDGLTVGELIEASGLRIPLTPLVLFGSQDGLGQQVDAILDSLRDPLKCPLERPLSAVLRHAARTDHEATSGE